MAFQEAQPTGYINGIFPTLMKRFLYLNSKIQIGLMFFLGIQIQQMSLLLFKISTISHLDAAIRKLTSKGIRSFPNHSGRLRHGSSM